MPDPLFISTELSPVASSSHCFVLSNYRLLPVLCCPLSWLIFTPVTLSLWKPHFLKAFGKSQSLISFQCFRVRWTSAPHSLPVQMTFLAHISSMLVLLLSSIITSSCLQWVQTVGKYTGLGGSLWVTKSISMLPVLPRCAIPFTLYWFLAVSHPRKACSQNSYNYKPSPDVKADCTNGWFIHIFSHRNRNKFYALATLSIWLPYFNSNNIFPSLAFHSFVLLGIREEKRKQKQISD